MAVYSNYGIDTEENYLEGCEPDVSVIPKYATLNEMSYHVVEASEADFNRLMMECGVSELYHLESTGTEMIYEDGKIASLKNNVVNFFQEMWKKVQRMIQKAIETFQEKSQKLRKDLIGKIDKSFLQKRVDNIPADKNFGTTYDYENITQFSDETRKFIEKADAKLDALRDQMISQQKAGTKQSYDQEIDDIVKRCVNDLVYDDGSKGSATSSAGLAKVMKSCIRNQSFQVSGKWVKDNFYKGLNIYNEVLEYPATKAQLKKDYKTLQKSFNDAIKKCKKADNSKTFEASSFTKVIKGYKSLRQIAVYSEQAVISCLNERYSFFRSVLFKLIGVKAAQDEKKSTNESTTFDTIGSLFDNWD